MGKRGPRPTPTETLKLRGSWRANRNPGEPQPERAIPPCPDWLTPEARAVWTQLAEVLDRMRVLTMADANALTRYCSMWVRWRKAEEFIHRYGPTYPVKDDQGRTKCFQQFPEVAIAHRLSLALSRIEAEFGLTPSSRTRINVELGVQAPRMLSPIDEKKRAFFQFRPSTRP